MVLSIKVDSKKFYHVFGGVPDFGKRVSMNLSRRLITEQGLTSINNCYLKVVVSDPNDELRNVTACNKIFNRIEWDVYGLDVEYFNLDDISMQVGQKEEGNLKTFMICVPWLNKDGEIPKLFLDGFRDIRLLVEYASGFEKATVDDTVLYLC